MSFRHFTSTAKLEIGRLICGFDPKPSPNNMDFVSQLQFPIRLLAIGGGFEAGLSNPALQPTPAKRGGHG